MAPQVVCLQPIAVVDHVIEGKKENTELLGEGQRVGGSQRVTRQELQTLLVKAGQFVTNAAGSAANVARSLTAGFEVETRLVGSVGKDEWGAIYLRAMERSGVDVSLMLEKEGSTGRCAIIAHGNERTMRTDMEDAVRLSFEDLKSANLEGAEWLLLNGYALYGKDLLQKSIGAAREAGCKVALDLGSFEVVAAHRDEIRGLIERAEVHLILGNEDETAELMKGPKAEETYKAALKYYVDSGVETGVVMMGSKGCMALAKGVDEVVIHPAFTAIDVISTIGAGDTFTAGFLYTLMQEGSSLKRACEVGCLAGAAVVQTLGSEVQESGWRWMNARMHGELAATVARSSAAAVQKELLHCYSLIAKLGRGVVYYGSARLKESSPHWDKAVELGREVAKMLNVTTWSGGGPGMMEAATRGALMANKPVGGIRIEREAGQVVKLVQGEHYLPKGHAAFCKYLSPRKVALVDSAVRETAEDRTAYIFLPGGLGTMDEFFELLTLIQLKKLGTQHKVPLVLCSYDGFYNGLQTFIADCAKNGVVGVNEYSDLKIFETNEEILAFLADFYNIKQ